MKISKWIVRYTGDKFQQTLYNLRDEVSSFNLSKSSSVQGGILKKDTAMIVILSPSKTQRVTLVSDNENSLPPLLEKTGILVERLKQYNRRDLEKLMNISEKLADLTYTRIHDFTLKHDTRTAGTAITTFQGDAFSALTIDSWGPEDFGFAQGHLRILSGLYGVLRPLDLMQPYRLEMAAGLSSEGSRNLYDFWGTAITETLNADLRSRPNQVIVNCASKEYSRVIQQKQLIASLVTITFRQMKNNVLKSIAIYAKRARGMFVDYLIKNRIRDVEQLQDFAAGGYRFAPELSSNTELVFVTVLD